MLRVKRSEVMDALNYFHGAGYIEQLRSDEQYYVTILMKFAAQRCDVELVGIE
jgi:hypothetical protein